MNGFKDTTKTCYTKVGPVGVGLRGAAAISRIGKQYRTGMLHQPVKPTK